MAAVAAGRIRQSLARSRPGPEGWCRFTGLVLPALSQKVTGAEGALEGRQRLPPPPAAPGQGVCALQVWPFLSQIWPSPLPGCGCHSHVPATFTRTSRRGSCSGSPLSAIPGLCFWDPHAHPGSFGREVGAGLSGHAPLLADFLAALMSQQGRYRPKSLSHPALLGTPCVSHPALPAGASAGDVLALPRGRGLSCGTQQDAVSCHFLPQFAPGNEFPGIQAFIQARFLLGETHGDLCWDRRGKRGSGRAELWAGPIHRMLPVAPSRPSVRGAAATAQR